MAFSLRDQPELDPASAGTALGGSNGRVGAAAADPAHGGPLPDATLPELVGRLINDLSDLADRQVELAKQEVNEARDQAVRAVLSIGIGLGIAFAAGLFLTIWFWTAVIWFFNWLGAFIIIGSFNLGWLGWVVGMVVPLALLWFLAWQRFIKGGINRARHIWPPLPRTRTTLKEDLEWLQNQRTRSRR